MIRIICDVIERATGKHVAEREATKPTRALAMEDIVAQVEVGFGPVGDEGEYDLVVILDKEEEKLY